MLKLTVALGLLATCCLAQVPERPYFPETFMAEYTAEQTYYDQTGEVKEYGYGWRAYDYGGQRGVHNTTFENSKGSEIHYRLELYDIGKTFSIQSQSGFYPRCTNEDLFGKYSPYFDWVSFSRYKGRHEWMDMGELDFWGVEVGADIHEVGVRPTDTSMPVAYIHQHEYQSRTFIETFTEFRDTTPSDDFFNIPAICEKAQQPMQHHGELRRSARPYHSARPRRSLRHPRK